MTQTDRVWIYFRFFTRSHIDGTDWKNPRNFRVNYHETQSYQVKVTPGLDTVSVKLQRREGPGDHETPRIYTSEQFAEREEGKILEALLRDRELKSLDGVLISEHRDPGFVTVNGEKVMFDREAAEAAHEKAITKISSGYGFNQAEVQKILDIVGDIDSAFVVVDWAKEAVPAKHRDVAILWDRAVTLATAMIKGDGPEGWARQVAVIKACGLPEVPLLVQGRAWKTNTFFSAARAALLSPTFMISRKI